MKKLTPDEIKAVADRAEGKETDTADYEFKLGGKVVDAEMLDEAADAAKHFEAVLSNHIACLDPVMFINTVEKKKVSEKAFDYAYNRVVNQFCTGKDARRYLDRASKLAIASPGLELVAGICYRPGADDFVEEDSRLLFNLHKRPKITPLAETPRIFFQHMKYLIPNLRERQLVICYLASMVQKPLHKINYALLIYGEGGTGKSWIGELMEVLLGADNSVLLEADDPLKDMFNGFHENKQMVFVHELAGDPKIDLVAKLKGVITQKDMWINEKYIARHKAENRANILAASNHAEALKIVRNNRRWAVARAADDPVGVDDRGRETDATVAYYDQLFASIGSPMAPGDEARRIYHYLLNLDLAKLGFNAKGLAPQTDAKDEVASASSEGLSGDMQRAYENREGAFAYDLLIPEEVARQLKVGNDKTLTSIMQAVGCRKLRRAGGGKGIQISVNGVQRYLWASSISAAKQHAAKSTAELTELFKAQRNGKAVEVPPSEFEEDV